MGECVDVVVMSTSSLYVGDCVDVVVRIFCAGQHFRLSGEFQTAFPYIKKAATLPIPNRALFQWHYLYNCLSKLELGRTVQAMNSGEV